MPPPQREAWTERVAIMVIDGGLHTQKPSAWAGRAPLQAPRREGARPRWDNAPGPGLAVAGQAAGGIQAHPVADGRHLRHTGGSDR